jgi:hypothetical protein
VEPTCTIVSNQLTASGGAPLRHLVASSKVDRVPSFVGST